MDFIYKALLTRLSEIPGIKYIDMDKGQFEMERPPVSFPACLISLQIASTQENSRKNLHKQVIVSIRMGWDFFGNTSNITPEGVRNQSLAYFDLIQEVYEKLQGWEDGTRSFNYLSQMALREEKRPDYKIINIPFKTSFHDSTADI